MKEVEQLIRPDLLKLEPYSSARDEFQGEADVYIDANENPFNSRFNRYPDPLQRELKNKISEIKNINSDQLFLGNGSDEVLDLIFRLFCIVGEDEVMITPPTYGMYKVLAAVNNVHVNEVNLDEHFQLSTSSIFKKYNRKTKILLLCTPNNPVGNVLDRTTVLEILASFPGIVVIDEAYIDFSNKESYVGLLDKYPRLIVTQTLSKAWGMAGLRLGMAITNPYIVNQLNKIKPPYNVNILTQKTALEQLNKYDEFQLQLNKIIDQRIVLHRDLSELKMIQKIFDSEANFLLVRVPNANDVYAYLAQNGVIVRNRSNQIGCENCLRLTIGTERENQQLVRLLKMYEKKQS